MELKTFRHKDPEPERNDSRHVSAPYHPLAGLWRSRFLLWLFPVLFLIIFFFFPLSKILALTFNSSVFADKDTLSITLRAIRFTFYQATLSTLLTFVLGFPSAILFARFDFRGKPFLRALTAIPFMLPTVVVAAAFNSLLGSRGFIFLLSSFFTSSSFQFQGTLTAILIAHIF